MMTSELFDSERTHSWDEPLAPGAVVLRRFVLADEAAILAALNAVIAAAPLRHMVTPGGYRMSEAMSNCGALGWVPDASGYRYDPVDPGRGRPWPAMPDTFRTLARAAAARAGIDGFTPAACRIKCYAPGARL